MEFIFLYYRTMVCFCQQVSWELFGCFPNSAAKQLIHLKRQEHCIPMSTCCDFLLKSCLKASLLPCWCSEFLTENENGTTLMFVLL